MRSGAMMQLQNNVTVIEEFASELAESVSVFYKVFWIMLVYNPPKNNKIANVEDFEKLLEQITNKKHRAKICGYFNTNVLRTTKLSSKYNDVIGINVINQLISQPTRIGSNCESLLDHIILKNVIVELAHMLENKSFSDYSSIILELYTLNTSMTLSKMYRDTTFYKFIGIQLNLILLQCMSYSNTKHWTRPNRLMV